MKYFVDPYKKYYEKLSGLGNIASQASSISSSIESPKSTISNLSSSVDDSKWSEMGITELKTNVLPSLLQNHDTLANNINNTLVKIVSKATGELLPVLESLKTEDEKLDELNKELDTLLANPEYEVDSEGKPTSTLTEKYKNEVANKEKEIKKCEDKCKDLVQQANDIVSEIKALDSSVEDFKVDISSASASSSGTTEAILGQSVKDGKMIEIEFNGRKFYIANTRINALEYQEYLQAVKMYQNAGFMDGQCGLLSQVYAVDMMRGTLTGRSLDAVKAQAAATRVGYGGAGIAAENIEDLYEFLYNEAASGRVTTLNVTQRNTIRTENGYRGDRHVVTFIGFDSSVKGPEDLNPDTILVLDCVDGKIQTLSQARSEGGHERDVYAFGGLYHAGAATEDFLVEEVENDEWYEKHGAKL